jgi:uncharacterized protein (TIGR02996 family)
MTVLQGLLDAIVADPLANDLYLVLADWLEEHDDPRRSELLRLHRQLLATCCELGPDPERDGWHLRIVELLEQGVRPCVPQRSVVLAEGVEMIFSFIPPGDFLMGSPDDEEDREPIEDLHRMTLAEGFWLGIHQVTQAQWQAVMGDNPSKFKSADRPVELVPWQGCQEFCRTLGERAGNRYRLPSEAEWERACRAGTVTAYSCGDSPETLAKFGWCSRDGKWGSAAETKPVGQYWPNAWGLYDMHGNVWEWCQEQYEEGKLGWRKPTSAEVRILRGGSWLDAPSHCRSAYRGWREPDRPGSNFGFRVCLCPE